VVSGSVKVKDYSFLGVNSTLRDSIVIEEESLIGAGAVLLKSSDDIEEVYSQHGTVKLDKKSSEMRRI
jgi:carbonic anhydrase/acetyltransferase-like protein (isoleucine patch superfamily)